MMWLLMRKIPFHRRILPIIFIIAFLGFAPVIIFYTSGYRWNAKKGKVERYGTVIFDTTPTGARILVDNREIPNKTPITIQDMPPGTHRFELTRDGYSTWAKSLDVLPEKVTFVNNIWLWKNSVPSMFYPSLAQTASHSPDNTHILFAAASPTQTFVLDTSDKSIRTLNLNGSEIPLDNVRWSENGRYAVIGANRTAVQPWLVDSYGQRAPLALAPADYRWSGSTLVGNDQKSIISIKGSDFSLVRTPLPQDVRDISDLAELRYASGTSNLVYVMLNRPDQGLVMPPGDWIFDSFEKDLAFLKDGDRWLALAYKKDPPEYHTVTGEELHALTLKRQTTYLTVNGTEIWMWNGTDDPELILRHGEPIINAAWHREGYNLFFATQKSVFALELDIRDRRLVTRLADFDEIRSFSVSGKRLYILANKDGQDGLWTLDVE
jgi:hypothetical protein